MGPVSSVPMLVASAVLLGGCGPLFVIGYGVALAITPEPATTSSVTEEVEPGVCRSIVSGEPRDGHLRGVFERYYSAASTLRPTEVSVADWRRGQPGRFVVLAGRREPEPADMVLSGFGRPNDAGRAYFDFNSDGTSDLVYEIFGPPSFTPTYVVLPAQDELRLSFESQLGQLSQDWRPGVVARGGHVVEAPNSDLDRLATSDRGSIVALPTFAALHVENTTYMVVWERDVPFDLARNEVPLVLADAKLDADGFKIASIATVYRVNTNFVLEPQCKLVGQQLEPALGGP
jgi:hypothetical protein